MNHQFRAYEDPLPRVPPLPHYEYMPLLSPPHTPVSPPTQHIPGDVTISDSLLEFVHEMNLLPQRLPGDISMSESLLDFVFEIMDDE